MPHQTDEKIPQFDIVEARISDIRAALDSNTVTAVELAAECLHRVARYDCNGPRINAIPVLNPSIFDDALASDERRASGKTQSHLDGVPYTVKDSYQVKGMTVANGSPALKDLVSSEDAFAVHALKGAGAVMVGRTNMPPMAAGGMQRGVYGRAENPYNPDYLAAAFASGSSNGSAASTAASFAAFGLGSETVSSGRSPASNNALVAYTPSRGYVSIRGVWPLYPTCDDLVPHTRSVDDMLELLDVISVEDPITAGDFWRDQEFVHILKPDYNITYRDLPASSLVGLRIAVPSCYIGGPQLAHSLPVHTSPRVVTLWEQARKDLESQGAEVIIVDEFPLVQVYDNPESAAALAHFDTPRLPDGWNSVERGMLIARTWDAFLRQNADLSLSSLLDVDTSRLFPAVTADHPQIAYAEPTNAIHYSKLKEYLLEAIESNPEGTNLLYATPNLAEACRTLEILRKLLLEDWLVKNKFDMVVFPAAGDVGKADADITHESGKHAWANGVKYSNGNRAIRHLGVPSVTVPMGVLDGIGVPVGLTFFGPAYSDAKLLGWAKAFEGIRQRRTAPALAPSIARCSSKNLRTRRSCPRLMIENCVASPTHSAEVNIGIRGCLITSTEESENASPHIEVFIDSHLVPSSEVEMSKRDSGATGQSNANTVYDFSCEITTPAPRPREGHERPEAVVAGDKTMVVILGRVTNEAEGWKSRPYGWFTLV